MSTGGGSKSTFSTGKMGMVLHIKPAIIIYPALMTPEMLVGSDYIQLLLLGKKKNPITEYDINWQLKIQPGWDVEKNYYDKPLFKNEWDIKNCIKITKHSLDDTYHNTPTQFSGMIDKRLTNDKDGVFKKAGYDEVYNVNVTNAFIRENGLYNIFWTYSADSKYQTQAMDLGDDDSGSSPKLRPLNTMALGRCYANELHDWLIEDVIKSLNGEKIKEKGKYCFKVGDKDVDITSVDLANPIQAYHPLIYYKDLSYANVAHISDLHVNSRQNILSKSTARVIDYSAKNSDGTVEEKDKDISPNIGSILNIYSRNIKELFDTIGKDPKIQVLLISGDLIDHIKNVYIGEIKDFNKYNPSVKKIWDTVALDSKYKDRYQDFVDYISFYSLVVYFYKEYKKPIYVVSGNHDCYLEPYGIFPRVLADLIEANPGIPADHNLTIYEALLAFGDPTWDELKLGSLRALFEGSFYLEKLAWFYTVLTPFSDFTIQLPNQFLVGLAWGDEEDVKGDPIRDSRQGSWKQLLGHLPRADLAISKNQLNLLKRCLFKRSKEGVKKRVILTSHFTFVSYVESIPFDTNSEGDVEFDWAWDACKYDMGTFETNRKEIYEGYLAKKPSPIQCLLSGHSHRKGLYTVLKADYSGDNSVKTAVSKISDFKNYKLKDLRTDSIVMVSDSAGPVPRCNYKSEFVEWGSDNPSGSKVIFGSNGAIESVEPIKTSVKPRFAVALDYMDVLTEHKFIKKFDSDPVDPTEERLYHSDNLRVNYIYAFSFWWKLFPEWLSKKIYVNSPMYLYSYSRKSGWKKIVLTYDAGRNKWAIRDKNGSKLFWQFASRQRSGNFLSIKFGLRSKTYLTQYDFDSCWNFPIDVKAYRLYGELTYHLRRYSSISSTEPKFPNFGWRKSLDKYK